MVAGHRDGDSPLSVPGIALRKWRSGLGRGMAGLSSYGRAKAVQASFGQRLRAHLELAPTCHYREELPDP